ncbi:MAG: HEAT repeat domain-containing protein [Planctomycetota bacterium]|jgi:hypothetical protein
MTPRTFLALFLMGFLALSFVGSGLAGEKPPEEEEGPTYDVATEEEETKILDLLAKIPPPEHLRKDLRIPDEKSRPTKAETPKEEEKVKAALPTDPFVNLELTKDERKKLLEELAKTPMKKRGDYIRKQLKKYADREKKTTSSRDDDIPSEGVKPRGMKEEDFEEAYEKARAKMDRDAKDQKNRLPEVQAYNKGLAEAKAGLMKFGQKATPFIARALEKADLYSGSVLIEVLSITRDDPRADKDIVAWLDRRPFRVSIQGTQENFLKSLGRKIPTPEGLIPALERALMRAHWQNRSAFLRALFSARNPDTVEPIAKALLRFLTKGDRTNNEVALNFLFYLLPDPDVPQEVKGDIIDTVTGMIWNPNYKNLALSATMALGRSGHEDAVEPLGELLEHRNGRVVLYAIRSLGGLGKKSKPVVREITEFLDEDYPTLLRRETAEALGRIRSDDAVWPLIEVLYEPEIPLAFRESVQRALTRICGKNLGRTAERWANWWEHEQDRRANETEEEREAREKKQGK